ncbi:hypothetical protein [Methylobacter tundripaludum]|uniref:hypothetical protein n=1 Tax=Methylobacter tundripaludum TaxID=173365 RepID=UPI0004DECC84|nr:hypothetical protein [Methylobacter tundripaludum]
MSGINWDDWLNREQLTLSELLLLSLEEDPNDKDLSFFDSIGLNNDEAYINRRGDAESWIRAGKLQGKRVNDGGSIEYFQIDPVRFFELAKSNNWDLAQEISDFLDKHQNLKNVTWSGSIQALEPLTAEQRQAYNKLAAWTWVDAIYILQGFKPCSQISTEQVRSHFPGEVNFFTQSIQLGNIGKEITQAGERTFIDSPAKWEAFWQCLYKPDAEQQAEALGDARAVDAQEGSKVYELYKKSLDALNIDLKSLKVEDIFKQVKLTDKKLWCIAYATFKRDVWPIYSKENNLGKQPGRPRNK